MSGLPAPSTTTRSLLRDRDFALLLSGTTVNEIGDWLLELALPVYVFVETGSGLSTAAVYLVGLVVRVLFGPLGGSFADRWNIRPTLVATNLLQIGALAPLFAVEPDRIWPVYIVVVSQGLISSVNDPASFAVLPRLVAGDQLVSANSAMTAGGSVARLVGSAVGGIAVATGGLSAVIVADSLTFAFAAVTAGALTGRADGPAADPDGPEYAADPDDAGNAEVRDSSVRTGLREVRARPVVGSLVWIQALAMFGFGAFPVLFIVFVTEYLDGGGTEIGIIRASSAFGGIAAAALIGGLAKRLHPADVMAGGYLSFAVIALLFVNAPPITTALGVYIALFALTGLPNVAAQVGTTSTAQRLCPPEVLGRLGGLMSAASAFGMGVGSIAAGLLLDRFTSRFLLNAQVGVLALCGAATVVFIARPLRRRDTEVPADLASPECE